jgi:hypothetical protein
MRLEKVQCWNALAGFHRAKIVDARLTKKNVNNKDEEDLKLIFEITSLTHPIKQYMARKVYKKTDSAQIITDFDHLFGSDINTVINQEGEIIAEGLLLLVGKAVDIEIMHFYGKGHDAPFCLVARVTKPGVLVEVIDDAEELKIAA